MTLRRAISLLAFLLCAASASGAPRTASPELAAVQLQVLEATKRANELNAEQNQKTIEQLRLMGQSAADQNKAAIENTHKIAQSSIEQNKKALDDVQKIAEGALTTARESNEHAKYMLTLWSAMLAGLAAVLIFVGLRELKDFRARRDTLIDDIKKEAKAELVKLMEASTASAQKIVDDLLAQSKAFEQRVDERFVTLGSLCIDVSTFINSYEAVGRAKKEDKRIDSPLIQGMFARLRIIEVGARELALVRTIGWVEAYRALLHFHCDSFDLAVDHQINARRHAVAHNKFDRDRNLCCFAWKLLEKSGSAATRQLLVNTLKELETYVDVAQTRILLADPDLTAAYAAFRERREALEAKLKADSD